MKPLFIYCALFFSAFLLAKAPQKATPIVYNTASITVDGKLDEAQWQAASTFYVNNITWPYENQPSPVNTEVKVYENGETLFVAFIADDPQPEKIRAFFHDRDSAWNDDQVGIKIDTYNNAKLAYQFFINPLGVQTDSIENELTKQESLAWDGIWDSAGAITNKGYVVEVAIPLRILNFNDSATSKIMSMEFVRFYPRNERLRLSNMKINHANNCWLCQMPAYSGFAKAKQGKNLTVVPSLVANKTQTRRPTAQQNEAWQTEQELSPSLDIKWGITPDVTLNATLKPDFSQVEADDAQLRVNNSFSLYTPEKRAFFLDNADYFASHTNLIYTRNIAQPDYGLKLTASKNDHTLAGFVSNDNKTHVLVPGNMGSRVVSINKKGEVAAFRYRFDGIEQLSLGTSTTHRQSEKYHNTLLSVDAKYKVTENDTFIAEYMRSNSQYSQDFIDALCQGDSCNYAQASSPCLSRLNCNYSEALLRVNKKKYSGYGYHLKYTHDQKNYRLFADYAARSRDFRADLGFVSQVDFNKLVTGAEYRWYGDKNTWWNRIRWYADWDITHNQAGTLLEKEAQTSLAVFGPWQSKLEYGVTARQRRGLRFDPSRLTIANNSQRFGENEHFIYAEVKPFAGLLAALNISTGNRLDLANNQLGQQIQISPKINYNLSRHLELRLRHTYRQLEANNAEVFTANLTDARISYQFNLQSFLRLSLIYTDIERNPQSYLYSVNQRSKSLATQLLYSYKINPQTVLFLGYSDSGYQNDDLTRIEKSQRTFFAKFSYAWLM